MKVSGAVHLQNSNISLGEIVWHSVTDLGSYDTQGAGDGIPVSFSVNATGPGAITYALTSGSLPPNLTLNTSNGTISGMGQATTTVAYDFTITASTLGLSSPMTFTITAMDTAGGDAGN